MPPVVIGWILLVDAETYMATRVGATKYWHSGAEKIAALMTAYNQLVACGLFDFPVDVSVNMKNAQCEMALFLLIHQEDMDTRMGLQAQGVTQAGIIQETYNPDNVDAIPIPPIVKTMLESYKTDTDIHVIGIERDEDEEIS
jgi:hypothetical protein